MPTPATDELLTVREAATILRVSPESVRRRVRAGSLPACRLSQRAIRIRRADLDTITTPDESLEAHIAKLVAAAPPLSPEQSTRIAMLFRPVAGATA
ncbi:helix-turn-helix domain-containing protein [Arthrobacter sp. U41]|uniref:helix-turn-helix domain-containing protein n=1 Tax=Arthrobacter sp. U41 TaxID=1849032 RepID=UPI000859595B|nr:helix-turn-helix domain-containing protein [Arthrobacter sp. U41]AOT04936.1 hypothetical protein ASPU41_18055 [Arthrobacter sp. U41]